MQTNQYIIEPVREFYHTQYLQPHRKYHNHTHINNMFLYAEFTEMMLAEEQIAAIYFHDIYYDIDSNDVLTNEEKSAWYAFEHMKRHFGYDEKRATIVKNIILDTMDHFPANGGDWSSPVLDLDLWGLFDFKEYKKNAWLIRQEYISTPWDDFLRGRKQWLEKMVVRDKIYHSPYVAMKSSMNDLAFKNLQRELEYIGCAERWTDFILGK